MSTIRLEPSWKAQLGCEFSKSYMQSLKSFLQQAKKSGKTIYPKSDHYFKAFELTPFDKVKVVILGQDPYHGPDQAQGLSFSVPKEIRLPPSLQNIYKELYADLGITPAQHGCLEAWAEQGVLLLNSVLTVEAHQAASHQGKGWEEFTDKAISRLNERREKIVFMLWGSYAQRKGSFIDQNRHKVLKSSHPSPLSAYRGFLGCKHFSATNAYLAEHNIETIDWRLTPI